MTCEWRSPEDLVLRNCFVVERVDNTWPNSPDRTARHKQSPKCINSCFDVTNQRQLGRQENELTLENELSVEMESGGLKPRFR